jgi:predicted amidohydrolase YtcJ
MLLKIPRLYDSHTHWLGTGQVANGLQLYSLSTPEDIRTIKLLPSHFRGGWLVGFGWNPALFKNYSKSAIALLNEVFPDAPVFFSSADGHSSWLNSLAAKELGLPAGHPGLLSEEDHFVAYSALPAYSDEQVYSALLRSNEIFNQAGFTHIRDLTCDQQQWQQALKMDQSKQLSLYVDVNFLCESPALLPKVIDLLVAARAEESSRLKVQGIKLFFDGTLGSDTAMLSGRPCLCNSPGKSQSFAWTKEDLEMVFRKVWAKGFEVSVHTIGDEAVHQVVTTARKVMATNERTGWLNLEHVQVLRPETLQQMKALHVRCHMQPCHWLSDKAWLKEKLGDLYKYAFPWGALSRSGIPLFFGSDSPVAEPSYWNNEQALRESVRARISGLKGDIVQFHTQPRKTELETYTVFENKTLTEVVFDGQQILPKINS